MRTLAWITAVVIVFWAFSGVLGEGQRRVVRVNLFPTPLQ